MTNKTVLKDLTSKTSSDFLNLRKKIQKYGNNVTSNVGGNVNITDEDIEYVELDSEEENKKTFFQNSLEERQHLPMIVFLVQKLNV